MTEIHLFKCDVCGKEFGYEAECLQCELEHGFDEYGLEIHIYDKRRRPLIIDKCDPDDIFFAHCDNKAAAQVFYNWCNSKGACSAYDEVFEKDAEFDTGVYFYDEDEEFSRGGKWICVRDLINQLEEMANYFQH